MFYSRFFATFYQKTLKFGFWVDGWMLDITSSFSEIFLKFRKSFGKSFGNLYIHFLVTIIWFRFGCGEEKLC